MPNAIRRVSNAVYANRTTSKKSLVFLGTPLIAAKVLDTLLKEQTKPKYPFEIDAVVSQPSKPTGRKNRKIPIDTPVTAKALEYGFRLDRDLLCPISPSDPQFLDQFEALSPDLCITAAYGSLLSERFLQIPRFGTLNIHPSLLPQYRGAAPVNRALQDGVTKTGVSVVLTVLQMDAGPILTSEEIDVDSNIQAPELTNELFARGTRLLIDALPSVFEGTAKYEIQNHERITFAPKLKSSENVVHFQSTATEIHNQVRAFTPWPGTRAKFKLFSTLNSSFRDMELKILETRVPRDSDLILVFQQGICFLNHRLFVECGDGSVLEVLRVQRIGGTEQTIRDFRNGLGKREILTI